MNKEDSDFLSKRTMEIMKKGFKFSDAQAQANEELAMKKNGYIKGESPKRKGLKKRYFLYFAIIVFILIKMASSNDNSKPIETYNNQESAPKKTIKITEKEAMLKINDTIKNSVGELAGSLVYRKPSYYKDKNMSAWDKIYGKKWHNMAIDVGVMAYTSGTCSKVDSVDVDFYSDNKNNPVINIDCGSYLYKNTYSEYMRAGGFISESEFDEKVAREIDDSLPNKDTFLSECDGEILSLADFPDTADTDLMTDVYNAAYKGKPVRAVDIRLSAKNAFGVPVHRDYQCFAGADGRYRIVDK